MKKIKLVILIIVIISSLFILTGCSSYGDIKGTVIKKEHKEAYHYTSFVKSGKVLVPISHNIPEQYKIEISKVENDETKTKWVNITKEKYETIQIGDWYEGE